jgi:hypothetical protein
MGAVVGIKVFAAFFLICLVTTAVFADSGPKVIGTYSSFVYNAEGGDLLGIEVHIVPTRHGIKAIVQAAEGEPGDIEVADLNQGAGGILSFNVPMIGQTGVTFEGRVTADGLKGKLIYPSGTSQEVFLKRAMSYWDKSEKKP